MIEANARPERTNRARTTNRKPDINATTMIPDVKCNAANARRMTASMIDARCNAPNAPRTDASRSDADKPVIRIDARCNVASVQRMASSRPEAEHPEIAINGRCAADHKLVEVRCR